VGHQGQALQETDRIRLTITPGRICIARRSAFRRAKRRGETRHQARQLDAIPSGSDTIEPRKDRRRHSTTDSQARSDRQIDVGNIWQQALVIEKNEKLNREREPHDRQQLRCSKHMREPYTADRARRHQRRNLRRDGDRRRCRRRRSHAQSEEAPGYDKSSDPRIGRAHAERGRTGRRRRDGARRCGGIRGVREKPIADVSRPETAWYRQRGGDSPGVIPMSDGRTSPTGRRERRPAAGQARP